VFAGARYDIVVPGSRASETGSAASLTRMRTCDFCGKQADDADTMTWMTSVENVRRKTYCDTCSREHLRAIEGKLDAEWW
jgi:hypothetical protein